jgi:hypothetical protein
MIDPGAKTYPRDQAAYLSKRKQLRES